MRVLAVVLLVTLLLTFVARGAGQSEDLGVITGTVSDPSSARVPGAALALQPRDGSAPLLARSGSDGGFRFQGVPQGEYLLSAEAAGFGAWLEPLRVGSRPGEPIEIVLPLPQVNTQLVVTASGTAQSIDEVSKSLSVVDGEEMESRAEYAWAEALRLSPGMRVQQNGGPGSFTKIKIRGLRNEDTALLIDGWRFRDAAAPQGDATGALGDLLLLDTSRFEVLRGSGSSLYGTNAIGGTINARTDPGGGPLHGQAAIEGGSLGLFLGRGSLAGGALGDRLRYSAGLAHLNVSSGIDGNDATRNSSGQGYLRYNLTPRAFLSASVLAGDSFLQLNSSPFAAPEDLLPHSGPVPGRPLPNDQLALLEAGLPFEWGDATYAPGPDDPDSQRSARFSSAAFTFSQRLTPSAGFRAGYHHALVRRSQPSGPGGAGYQPLFNSVDGAEGRIETIQAVGDTALGRANILSGGYEYERESYETRSRDENPDPAFRVDAAAAARQHSHTAFLQNQTRLLTDRLQFSLAGRAQSFSLSQPEFEGGAPAYQQLQLESPPNAYTADGSVSYFIPQTGTKIRAHAGNGYRSPSLYERFGSSFFFGFFSPFGDPHLRPERSLGLDGGIDQWLWNSRVRASVTYFYTRLQEIIVFDFSGAIDPSTDPYGRWGGYRNTGGGLARGVELSVQAALTKSLDVTASYTFTNSDQRTSTVRDGDFFQSFGISDHMVTCRAHQRLGRWDFTFDLFAASEYPFPFFTASGPRAFFMHGPVKADLAVGYFIPLGEGTGLKLFTRVENLLDRANYEDGFRTPGATASAGLKYVF